MQEAFFFINSTLGKHPGLGRKIQEKIIPPNTTEHKQPQ